MSEATTTLSVKVPATVKSRLDRLSESTSKSRSSLAADAITSYLDLYEWQVSEICEGLREAEAGELASQEEVTAVFDQWARMLEPDSLPSPWEHAVAHDQRRTSGHE